MKIFKTLTLAAFLTAATSIFAQDVPVESISILVSNKPVTEGKLAVGGSRTLTVAVTPDNATNKNVEWSTSDPGILSFVEGTATKIRGMKPGVAVVTASIGAVKAEYTVTVSMKDAKVGQYFFSDNTWEDSGIVPGKTCIGVIFYLNEDKRSGKIISLDQEDMLAWSKDNGTEAGASSFIDGEFNLSRIQAQENWQTNYPAEAWCVSKNSGDIRWYLPAVDELRQVFAASCGLTWVESGADESLKQINNWSGNSVTMLPGQDTNPYPTERAAFDKKFTNIGAQPFSTAKYWWSSTEAPENAAQMAEMLSFEGGYSNLQPKQLDFTCLTRAIATFSEKGSLGGVSEIGADRTASRLTVIYSAGNEVAEIFADSEIRSVSIYSISGTSEAVSAEINGDGAVIDLGNLGKGIYIVVARTANGVCSGKLAR